MSMGNCDIKDIKVMLDGEVIEGSFDEYLRAIVKDGVYFWINDYNLVEEEPNPVHKDSGSFEIEFNDFQTNYGFTIGEAVLNNPDCPDYCDDRYEFLIQELPGLTKKIKVLWHLKD